MSRPGWARRGAGTALMIVALVTSPLEAIAGPPSGGDPAPGGDETRSPEAEADWKRAEALFRQGSARYSAADYAGAIEAFQAALELASLHGFDKRVEYALLVNLARAHDHAYEVDREVTHLRTALEIYRRLVRVAPEGTEEHDEAVAGVPELEQRLELLEREPVDPDPEPEPEPEPKPKFEPEPEGHPGRGMLIGGGVALGLGVAGLGLMTFGIVSGQQAEADGVALTGQPDWTQAQVTEIDDRGSQANTLAIVGGVVGGAAVVAGATLVALGLVRKRSGSGAQARVLPYGGVSGGGALVEVKF